MSCFHPLSGYRSRHINPDTGKRAIVFNSKEGYVDLKVSVPCGQCIGCRLDRSRQWALRCILEASNWDDNCFITLTFRDECLPSGGSLDKSYFQKFMKNLRQFLCRNAWNPIDSCYVEIPRKHWLRGGNVLRYFHCGEYGESFSRPHYHACLFGFDFPDKYLWKVKGKSRYYRSETLEKLWPYGYCMIGDVTYDSAAYVARYVMKKWTGKDQGAHYQGRQPEYVTMSRRPGIARMWFDKFKDDVFPLDKVVYKGVKHSVPKYFSRCYELSNPEDYGSVKALRCEVARENKLSPERLKELEIVARDRLSKLKRHQEI